MPNMTVNEIIRLRRKELKLSQEEVAEGICAVSTYSRVENGTTKNPNREIIDPILQRLRLHDYGYGDFFKCVDNELEKVREQILEALAKEAVDTVDEHLYAYKRIMDNTSIRDKQFFAIAQLIWYQQSGIIISDYRERCQDVLKMTKPNIFLSDRIDFGYERLSYQEQLIINSIALEDLRLGNAISANVMLTDLFDYVRDQSDDSSAECRKKSVLCNNLSLTFASMRQYTKALSCNELSVSYLLKSTGFMHWSQILKTRATIQSLSGNGRESQKLDGLINTISGLDFLPYQIKVREDVDLVKMGITVL